MSEVARRLSELGYTLPSPPSPVASYVPAVEAGGWVFVSGQIPLCEGELVAAGPVPEPVCLERAQAAARQCLLNALGVLDGVFAGDWGRLEQVVRIAVYVRAEAGFGREPEVADGASLLLGEVLGPRGVHARAAVGAADLPRGAPVELELSAKLTPAG